LIYTVIDVNKHVICCL